jgi:hypothetical protein
VKVQLTSQETADGGDCKALTIGRVYEVLGIEAEWLRLLNDNREPVLYDPGCFSIVESSEPANWVSVMVDAVRYAYPPAWGRPGYFEDWHDGVASVRATFAKQLQAWFPDSAPSLAATESGAASSRELTIPE